MQKVLFVNPPSEFKTPVLPLGMASIAAYLKSGGINEISVIDAWAEDLNFEELESRISRSQADIVGIYMVSPRYEEARKTIETTKKALPNSIVIAGGPHPSALPTETLNEIPQLDICAIGEGELIMYELAMEHPLPTIKGIAYRDGKDIKLTLPREFIKNLDEMPFPARELFPLKKYTAPPPHGRKNPYFTIITSRGCPYQCAFCSKDVFKNNYRTRSPKNVCDEIEMLISKHHAKEILFADDDFSLNIQRAEEICEEILKRGLKFRWATSTRVDQVTEQLLSKMEQAGCWMVIYGVESGNQAILNAIEKRFTVERVISTFEMTKKVGLASQFDFIVGLPGETKESIQDTSNLIKKTKPNFISGGILIVYPGSRLFKLIQEGRYRGRLRTIKRFMKMPGIFFRGNYTVFEDNLTYEEIGEIVQKIERDFYLRPQYVWQSLKSIRSLSDFGYFFNGALTIIKSLIW